ncbi:MAG: squalene--hopene cyclase, partial [Tuberibacillus sp.]
MNALEQEINRLISKMFADQSEDGAWHYPFETGIATDCYMIILLRTLELDDEELIKGLVDRIVSKQLVNGAWKLFYDEEDGNLSATLEAYYALLSSGYVKKKDPMMQKAKRFILSKGGVTEAQLFTKIMLAMNGQYEWPILPVPILAMLLPKTFPINLYDVSIYGRANLVPILVLADKSFTIKRDPSPDLSDLLVYRERAGDASDSENYRSLLSEINHGIQMLADLPENLYSEALKRAEEYMLERIEPDGTFLNFFSSTFLMIFALISLGYSKNDSRIRHAMQGLKSMVTLIDGKLHCQYTTATVWNTALISYTLQEAGVPASNAVIHKANRYLLSRQHYKWGDWRFHNPNVQPGGWGFSNFNTINPDVDDTTAALRAIRVNAVSDDHYKRAWKKGVEWVVSMQNDDGGWPAFERNVNEKWLNLLPIEGGRDLLIDPSTVDLTGRTLEFFG